MRASLPEAHNGCAMVLLLAVLVSCEPGSKVVCFVIPDGYVGPIALVEHDVPGAVAPVVERREWVLAVSPNGIGSFKDLSVLHSWHQQKVRYATGSCLEQGMGIELFSGGHSSGKGRKVYWYYLGGEAEAKEFLFGSSAFRRRGEWLSERIEDQG